MIQGSDMDMDIGNVIVEKKVKSKTSDNIYSVFVFENAIACTCPAGGKKQICKHMINVVHEHLEDIREKAPIFFKKLMHAIEIKQDKNISYEEKLQEYAKVVYLDKSITTVSINNIKNLEKSDKIELNVFKPIVEHCRLYELYEFLNISRKSPYNLFFTPLYNEIKELNRIGFIKILPIKFNDYISNVNYTKDSLTKIIKSKNLKIPDKSNKQFLINLANSNNLFDDDMKNYCIIIATELFTTSKDIISYLYKNRSKYVENKKVLDIRFLREDTSINLSQSINIDYSMSSV